MSIYFQNAIENKIIDDFRFKMSEVLSFCDSPIKETLVLHLYNYFLTYREHDWENFEKIIFYEDMLFPHDKNFCPTEEDESIMREYIKKHQYRFAHGCYAKYNSFKTRVNFYEPPFLTEKRPIKNQPKRWGSIRQEYIVKPHYETSIEGTPYTIDVAIILNRLIDDKIVDKGMIGIECEDYEPNSSVSLKRKDDIIDRKLKKNGWDEIFRYAGSDILTLKTEDFSKIFSEIESVFYRNNDDVILDT
jgi:hypothetical protein